MFEQLKNKKNISKQFRKIALTFLDEAHRALAQRSVSKRGMGVHTARKQFKKLRGLLRLVRFALGEKKYKQQNIVFRDAGRPLSKVRDADVMIETLDDLLQHFKNRVSKRSFKTLRSNLLKRRTEIRKQTLEKENAMGKVDRIAKRMRDEIENLPDHPNQFGLYKKGVETVYDNGRQEMKTALKKQTDLNLHEWRKSAKYLRYQLEILEKLWEPVIGEMAKQAESLSDALGLDHDLAVLGDLVQGDLKDVCGPVEQELLIALIRQRRSELQKESKKIGTRLFAEAPKQFSQRLKKYWKSWGIKSPAAV
jgi:CHAD domain-containing protein